MIRESKILGRLMLIVSGVIFLVLGASTAVFIKEVRSEHVQNLRTAASNVVAPMLKEIRSLAQSSDNIDWVLKVQSINARRLYEDHDSSGVIEIIVLNQDDRVMAHNDIRLVGKPIREALNISSIRNGSISNEGEYYWVGDPIYIDQRYEPIGTVIVGFHDYELRQHVQTLLQKAATLFLIFFMLALGLTYYFVTRQITRPIVKLVETSKAISAGDYTRTVDVSSVDEIGDLARSLQQLQAAIRDKVTDLESYKAHLEEEVKKRTCEYLAAKVEAEESNRAKSRFLANMSHELRTPLNAVLGFSEILHARETSAEKLNYLSSINSAGNTLLALINEVLDFSKIESGKMEVQYTPFSPRELLQEVRAMFEQRAAESDLRLVTHCSEGLPDYLLCDAFRLKQVMMNLCSNAIKFTADGQVTLNLEAHDLRPQERRVTLVLSVSDTGKGIPKDQQEAIFSAFEQVKGQQASEYGGTGLGLAITQKLVGLLRGDIRVESEGAGQGSAFIVTIPDLEITDRDPLQDELAARADKQYRFAPATLLLVDDIPYNRDLVMTYLAGQPFKFLQANDGQEALALLEHSVPDMILTDLKMPVMDGHQLLIEISRRYPQRSYPIMLLTASVQDSDLRDNAGLCEEIISKPVCQSALLSAMARYLRVDITDKPPQSAEHNGAGLTELLLTADQAEKIFLLAQQGDISGLEMTVEEIGDNVTRQWFQEHVADFKLDDIMRRSARLLERQQP
ncbi:ATP-binding protein [Neptuniibacter halophilus]|uniref:ATP-binding protein n=1 Tax=Neptuniibacter halophilus TaxID=651666 RepID=UPI002572F263|nr:ATP-binding protein [Neptuniibacter halophilus]